MAENGRGVDADPGAGTDAESTGGLSGRVKAGAAIAVIGVVGFGIANFALGRLGAPTLGSAVWALGYLSTIVALWYVLLRPIDLDAGPDIVDEDAGVGAESDTTTERESGTIED